MEDNNTIIESEKLTKTEKIDKKVKSMEDDIKAKRLALKKLKRDLESEKAKEIFKLMDDTGIDIDAARKILEEAHQTGVANE